MTHLKKKIVILATTHRHQLPADPLSEDLKDCLAWLQKTFNWGFFWRSSLRTGGNRAASSSRRKLGFHGGMYAPLMNPNIKPIPDPLISPDMMAP